MRPWVWSSHLKNKIKQFILRVFYHNKRWTTTISAFTPHGVRKWRRRKLGPAGNSSHESKNWEARQKWTPECSAVGRQSLGQWVSRGATGKGGQSRGSKWHHFPDSREPSCAQWTSSWSSWCTECKSQMWKEIAGPGRNESWERKEMSPTHRGKHNRRPAWYALHEACHRLAWRELTLPKPVTPSSIYSPTTHCDSPPGWPEWGSGRATHVWECNYHPSDHHQPCHSRDIWLWTSCLFFLLLFWCVGSCSCVWVGSSVWWCTCRGQRTTSGVVLTLHLVWNGVLVVQHIKLIHLRVSTGSSSVYTSTSSHHRLVELWVCLALYGFWGPILRF